MILPPGCALPSPQQEARSCLRAYSWFATHPAGATQAAHEPQASSSYRARRNSQPTVANRRQPSPTVGRCRLSPRLPLCTRAACRAAARWRSRRPRARNPRARAAPPPRPPRQRPRPVPAALAPGRNKHGETVLKKRKRVEGRRVRGGVGSGAGVGVACGSSHRDRGVLSVGPWKRRRCVWAWLWRRGGYAS